MSVKQDIAGLKQGRIGRIAVMAVCCEDHMSLLVQNAVIRKNRELKHHLVDLCITVAADTENLFFYILKVEQ